MNLLKAIMWVLGVQICILLTPLLLVFASIVFTFMGTVAAVYFIKSLYDLEQDDENS